jgi:hypothetical protein
MPKARSPKPAHKHFILDQTKLTRARRVLGAKTETETIERALDQVLTEDQKNRLAWEANRRFFESGAEIVDVFGNLEE